MFPNRSRVVHASCRLVPFSSPWPTKVLTVPLWDGKHLLLFKSVQLGYCRELAFDSQSSFSLRTRVWWTLQVHDFDMCQLRCYQDPNCVRTNFNVNQNRQGCWTTPVIKAMRMNLTTERITSTTDRCKSKIFIYVHFLSHFVLLC